MSDFNVDDVLAQRPTYVTPYVEDTDMVTYHISVPLPVAERLELAAKRLSDEHGDSPERAIAGAIAAFLEPLERAGWFDGL